MEDQTLPPTTPADLLADAIALDRASNALDMRLARVLAVTKRMDLASLGYARFLAFCDAEVELSERRIYQLISLVESPLARIRAAVVDGRLAVSLAADAVGIPPEEEEAWLEAALAGHISPPVPDLKVEFTGEDVVTIHAARTLARLNIGHPVSDATADAHILEAWREDRPRQKLLDDARATPPAPAPLPPFGPDPADHVAGPWIEPVDPEHALALLRVVTFLRKERVPQLAGMLDRIALERAYAVAGFKNFGEWVKASLSIKIRTVQRYRKALVNAPDLDLQRALFLDDIATEDTRAEWEAIVPLVPIAELNRVRTLVARGDEALLRKEYVSAIARLFTSGATFGAKRVYVSLAATLPPPRAPRATQAHPDLPAAARWYLDRGRTPTPTGIGRILLRDAFTCPNPECAARHLRMHVHHLKPRAQGGSDAWNNLAPLCPGCHLRLRHSGHLSLEKRGEWLVFEFVDRQIWMIGHPVCAPGKES
jgi:hypothetical protein